MSNPEYSLDPHYLASMQERKAKLDTTHTLALDVSYAPVRLLQQAIATRLGGIQLLDRGEAHQTILPPVFPPGVAQLTHMLTSENLRVLDIMIGKPINIHGVGCLPYLNSDGIEMGVEDLCKFIEEQSARENGASVTLFLVTEPLPAEVEEVIQKAKNKLAMENPDLNIPAPLTPHITVGFTRTDLFGAKTVNSRLSAELEAELEMIRNNELYYTSVVGQMKKSLPDHPDQTILVYESI